MRRARLRKAHEFVRKAAPDMIDGSRMSIWKSMVRCLWSDPWRREMTNRHDLVNVMRNAEQIEAWYLAAVEEREAGRDGSDHHHHHSGTAEKEAAREEEADLNRKRSVGREASRKRTERVEEAQTKEVERHRERLKAWFRGKAKGEQDRITGIVEREIQAKTNGKEPSETMMMMVWISVLTKESGLRIGPGNGPDRLTT